LELQEYLKYVNRSHKFGPDYTFAMYILRSDFDAPRNENDHINKNYYKRMKTFKENHKMIGMNWKVNQFSQIYDQIEKFVLEAHQHGLVQYHISKYTPLPAPNPPPPGPQVLTIYMLSAGFIVWLVTVLAACLMFVFEHIYFYFKITTKIKKFKKKMKTVIQKASKKFCSSELKWTRNMNTKKTMIKSKKKDQKSLNEKKSKKQFL
jgi:hypothetical protein